MSSLLIDNFMGGLNVRDSPNALTIYEATKLNNLTMDEMGGLVQRPGCVTAIALPGSASTKAYPFYSKALDQVLCVRESGGVMKLFSRPGDLSGSWTDRGQVSTTLTARAAFVEFPGNPPKVVIVLANDPETGGGTVGGIWTYDGTSSVANVSTAIGGCCIALWQNRVWVGGFPLNNSDGNRTRIFYSGRGDPTVWNTTTQFIDVRAKDAQPITALGVASGSLISFKRDSAYRHKDAETGDFDIIDVGVGCINPQAITPLRGRLYVWAADGIYETDGVGSLINVGDKLQPWYVSSITTPSSIVAATYRDRVIFNGTILGIGRTIELHPEQGWAVSHVMRNADVYSGFTRKGSQVYGAEPVGDDLVAMFSNPIAGDDQAGMDCNWTSAWLLPTSGMLARLNRVRVDGLLSDGDVVASLFRDYEDLDATSTLGSYSLTAALTMVGTNQVTASGVINQPARDALTGAVGQGQAFMVGVNFSSSVSAKLRAVQIVADSLADRSLRRVGYPKGSIPPPPKPRDRGRRPPPEPGPDPIPPPSD